jgi:hypothetical protein
LRRKRSRGSTQLTGVEPSSLSYNARNFTRASDACVLGDQVSR